MRNHILSIALLISALANNAQALESGKLKCVLTRDGETRIYMTSHKTKEDDNEARDIDLCDSSNQCEKMDFIVKSSRTDIMVMAKNGGTIVGYVTVSDVEENDNKKEIATDKVRKSLFVVRYSNGVLQMAGACGGSLFE